LGGEYGTIDHLILKTSDQAFCTFDHIKCMIVISNLHFLLHSLKVLFTLNIQCGMWYKCGTMNFEVWIKVRKLPLGTHTESFLRLLQLFGYCICYMLCTIFDAVSFSGYTVIGNFSNLVSSKRFKSGICIW
jgi:hypothetical protein